jgi:hypothetical protein
MNRHAVLAAVCAAAALAPAHGARAGAVIDWNAIASAVVALPAQADGTPAEQRPNYAVDLATVQIAVYDAVVAVEGGRFRPFAVTPKRAAAGASAEAAAGEAAYRVLRALFPRRGAAYEPAYERFVAALPAGAATDAGLALGAEVAAGVLAWRADDGRLLALPPFVPPVAGNEAGRFAGPALVGREFASIRPFALTSNAQFRAPGPPALDSARFAEDRAETRALGAADSTQRDAVLTETARFHTEPPLRFWPRNLRTLVPAAARNVDQARLLAMIWVSHADATNACFDSKYHFLFWRPFSAIAALDHDSAWKLVVPTPPHPEYPAAHACVAGALAETLRRYHGTPAVAFEFDSQVTQSRHRYDDVDAFVAEVARARIAGGMHFRSATVDGAALGRAVAAWIIERRFEARQATP